MDNSNNNILERMLAQVRLGDERKPGNHDVLHAALCRMLESPTAKALAGQFLSEGVQARIHFTPVDDSCLYETGEGLIFLGSRGFTSWNDGLAVITLNENYLAVDDEFRERDLPPAIAHELLGHGLWEARARREGIYQAFHHHELNETNARLAGWLVDMELDGRIESSGASNFSRDPEAFHHDLKFINPYYALTFSTEEMGRPIETLQSRLDTARRKRGEIEESLRNNESWHPMIDHFVAEHGVPEKRFSSLRSLLLATDADLQEKLIALNKIADAVAETLARCHAETERTSENYFRRAAGHPIFTALRDEVDRKSRLFFDLVRQSPAAPFSESDESRNTPDTDRGAQIAFSDLVEMCNQDLRDNPHHYRNGNTLPFPQP